MKAARLCFLFIILAAHVIITNQVWADTWQQALSARIATEYDTNPAMSPSAPDGVRRALFQPSFTLSGMLGENDLKMGLALQIARSSNESLSQNREDPSIFVDWQNQSAAGTFGITSRYAETSTRVTDIDSAGPGVVDSTRASRTLSGRWSRDMSERFSLSANGSYEGVFYKSGSYIDYATRSAGMMFRYAMKEGITSFFRGAYADYVPSDGGTSSRLASATLGLDLMLSDSLESTIQIGESIVSDAETITHGGASMHYKGQRTHLILNAGRQVLPSGLGGFVTVDQVTSSWNYDLSERSKTGIDLGWSKSHFVTDIINRTAGAWMQHDLTSFWVAREYYLHRTSEQHSIGEASSNILGIAFIYTHSDF